MQAWSCWEVQDRYKGMELGGVTSIRSHVRSLYDGTPVKWSLLWVSNGSDLRQILDPHQKTGRNF